MGMIIAGLVIFGPLTLIAGIDMPVIWFILGIPYGIYVLGFFLILGGSKKTGAIMIFIASVFFIPIGIISMMGARKILDEIKEKEFQKKRGGINAGQN